MLRIIKRKSDGRLYIVGPDPQRRPGKRIRQAARSQNLALAREEAATLEIRLLREFFHGRRSGDRPFAEIAEAYLEFESRHPAQIERVENIVVALGDIQACEIDQEMVDDLRKKLIQKARPSPATVRALVVTPLRAVLNFGFRRGWCDKPSFELPKQRKGKTVFVTPDEAERLIAAAAPHLRVLLTFLLCVGSRLAETLKLDWRDIDLKKGIARIIQKGDRLRIAHLPPAALAALAALPHRQGPLFHWETNVGSKARGRRTGTYAAKPKGGGGQIKTGWNAAIRRAGLQGRGLTPHATRHTWATWKAAILNGDLLRLKHEGAWETVAMVERYAHLIDEEHKPAIMVFWGYPASVAEPRPAESGAILAQPDPEKAISA
jgi:integrase